MTTSTTKKRAIDQYKNTPFCPPLEYISQQSLRPMLQVVEKPGRYVGGEYGLAKKNPEKAEVRVLLSYPDTYELGMSNEGLRILYDCVNRNDAFMADRAYLPWPDFRKEMQKKNIPLYSLGHFLSVKSFDLWGFNTSHELHYTNLCYALELADISILRKERSPQDPIVLTGGTSVSNPFPLFDFMDGIFLGDGEEGIIEIANIIANGKKKKKNRKSILQDLQVVDGLILPEFYTIHDYGLDKYPEYQGGLVKKRNYKGQSFSALKYSIVPNIKITQDRVVVEVARGCGQGCRFCHAGFWKRPVRNSEVSSLVRTAGEMLKKTGHNSISLHSLSIADYPWLEELVVEMAQKYGQNGVSLSLPSLRVQVKTIPVLEMTSQIRRSSITFALEAGSELQRERIRKKSSEENLHYLIRETYKRGWNLVKVYFMMGLPDKDGSEIQDLIKSMIALGKIAEESGPRKRVNITVSLFVPKPFTTFQWEKQQTPDYFRLGLKEIYTRVKSKRIHLSGPNAEMPYIEGLLSRSDHRVGYWILKAYKRGACFDSWDDQFNPKIWSEICDEIPQELSKLWMEKKSLGIQLPWHNIIEGVKVESLQKDYGRYENVDETNMKPPHPQALRQSDFPPSLLKPVSIPSEKFQTKSILAIHYSRNLAIIYVSHLEIAEIFRRGLRRIEVPMTFSNGYNKQEKLHFFDNLPLYFYSERESLYIEIYDSSFFSSSSVIEEKKEALQCALPKGIEICELELLEKLPNSLTINKEKNTYRLDFLERKLAQKCWESLKTAPPSFSYERPPRVKKKKKKRITQEAKRIERLLGSSLENIHFIEKTNSLYLDLLRPSEGGISMKDLLIHYLKITPQVWNVAVQITRIK